ncbi:MAG TPA: FGGY-family carbohydrate kinase [Anaerovoracaceae bacterium]|nr:FGGY-family carbohydrate kinase [Anaerovoracaceae bacterium]
MTYVIAYDLGTTGVKTCLFGIGKNIELISGAHQGYGLYLVGNGGAEQDAEEWWSAMCSTSKKLLADAGVKPSEVAGISFCSQMQGLVLVDKNGVPVRKPMSYMDQRAGKEIREGLTHGVQIAGANIFKLAKSLIITRAAPTSVKDPVWKYKWVERNEPENFARIHQWLDVKEYLIHRCTGRFVMTEDSAFATMLYDTRRGKRGWSETLCSMYGVRMEHLPEIIKTTDNAGGLTQKASADLGLVPGIPVFGGGGDATLIGIGAGCAEVGDTHIYLGTSGWVSTIVDKQRVDADKMIAAIVGAQSGRYNYFAEMETAGKCLEWVKDHLALDEIGIYLEKKHVAESQEAVYTNLYDYLMETIKEIEPGAGGVIFTPWLHGNRCPFEDPNAAGIFFNITLDTGKTELIRAVVEGVCYHLRWMLECQENKIKTSGTIRFVGGGALSPITGQILADITGHRIDVVANPQNVGAVGAAAVIGVGLGIIPNLETVKEYIASEQIFIPDEKAKAVYDRNFEVFKKLYQSNKDSFKALHLND